MSVEIRALPIDPTSLRGLSERLIVSHHENNYSGAVKRLNAIRGKLAELDYSNETGFLINGLKREELVAYNSMILHELYFAVLGGAANCHPAIYGMPSSVTSEAWLAGKPSSPQWAKHWQVVPAGCCWSGHRVMVGSAINGELITVTSWREERPFWPRICTSTLTTSTTARRQQLMWMLL